MPIRKSPPYRPSQSLVLPRGFQALGRYTALLDRAGRPRLFAELSADPDRPEPRPQEAYTALLSSMQPGWQLRLLQAGWPDPEPRRSFLARAAAWQPSGRGPALLQEGLLLFLQDEPLPLLHRTILEFALPGEAGLAWWDGLPALLAGFGLAFRPLAEAEIAALARQILSPELSMP